MGAYVAFTQSTQNGIDQRMKKYVGIAVSGEPLVMIDLNTTEPKFFPVLQPVHIVSQTDTNSWNRASGSWCAGRGKVLRKGKLGEPVIPFHQNDVAAGGFKHLRIVPGVGGTGPAAVRGKDWIEPEGLRGLNAAEVLAFCLVGHSAIAGDHEAVHDR